MIIYSPENRLRVRKKERERERERERAKEREREEIARERGEALKLVLRHIWLKH